MDVPSFRRLVWRRRAVPRAVMAMGIILLAASALNAPAQAQSWDIPSLNQAIQPMQHSLNGRMPLLVWSLPGVPIDASAVTMRSDGSLAANINVLWSKGISPPVNLAWGTPDGANATAATLQDAGIPIHLFADPPAWVANYTQVGSCAYQHYPWDFWPPGNADWFDDNIDCTGELWPVFPLATPTAGYNALKQQLQQLYSGDSANGLPGIAAVNGMWMDYEAMPIYLNLVTLPQSQLNGVLASGRTVVSYYDDPTVPFPGNGQTVNQVYGDVLHSPGPYYTNMEQYAWDLGRWLLDQSARKALTEVYGSGAWFGYFTDFFSSVGLPAYDENGFLYPINHLPIAGTAAGPAPYADNIQLPGHLGGSGQTVNQPDADDVYWFLMLRYVSSSARNAGTTGQSIAWVCQYVRDETSGTYDYPMTVSLYQEFLRHVWLRGNMGMYVFNPYNSTPPPPYTSGADYSFKQIEYVRAVMDEMLSFRSFLDNGTPMNFGYNNMFDHSPIWSGLALNGQAVVRAVSPNSATTNTIASITVPGGSTFANLAAPPGGATYLLGPGTVQHRVDSRPAALYLQFESNYQDSSGSNLSAVPSGAAAPTFAMNVPNSSGVTSVLNGAYGLYANQDNQYSVALASSSSQQGSSVEVADANGVFNSPSFTVEAFVNIDPASPDLANILSKGLSPSAGGFDWQLLYRSSGLLRLRVGIPGGGLYELQNSKATVLTPGWHHLAFTYNASSGSPTPQVTLYVDHVQAVWAFTSDGNHSGMLPQPMLRNTGDNFVIGFFAQGISASVDEVRFTPEVLDPMQMLTVGALQ
jgi:Concanavalin A-like lectin/glucanases superfamily